MTSYNMTSYEDFQARYISRKEYHCSVETKCLVHFLHFSSCGQKLLNKSIHGLLVERKMRSHLPFDGQYMETLVNNTVY